MDDDFEDRVRSRAYELWQLNGQPDGLDLEFWSIALQELTPVPRPDRDQQAVAAGRLPPIGSGS